MPNAYAIHATDKYRHKTNETLVFVAGCQATRPVNAWSLHCMPVLNQGSLRLSLGMYDQKPMTHKQMSVTGYRPTSEQKSTNVKCITKVAL